MGDIGVARESTRKMPKILLFDTNSKPSNPNTTPTPVLPSPTHINFVSKIQAFLLLEKMVDHTQLKKKKVPDFDTSS